ncbi:uncharacterized protein MONBRDRAFT_32065 [Monosiga brevicollis MX1]|uniref:Dynactin subunit 2 n=1 Tax=Monosiga brevicollis TaxID=81824 RepID=A9UX64_MONBE|nr:uncharacterized protein MONBRDRAFT_32065 [Monosiga brevicollis MX1]EDQ90163.1 predicted protein [Monosiga brevicollis MX1]|eukprot:XP_001744930.1 hypothetical protein [Monosiga brevicollis MX1]
MYSNKPTPASITYSQAGSPHLLNLYQKIVLPETGRQQKQPPTTKAAAHSRLSKCNEQQTGDKIVGSWVISFLIKEPEIYETQDETLSEGLVTDSRPNVAAFPSEDIAEDSFDPQASAQRFRDASSLDATGVDFSDKLGLRPDGYRTLQLAEAEATDESLEEKYTRLRLEVSQFLSEVEAAKAAVDTDEHSQEEAATAIKIAAQIQSMQDQLTQVRLDELLGGKTAPIDSTPSADNDAIKRLMAAVAKTKARAAEGAEGAEGKEKGVTYELIYTPEQARYQQLSRAAELEKRIAELESRVGTTNLDSISRFLSVSDSSVSEAVSQLAVRVDALNENSLADLEGKMKNVRESLAKIQEAAQSASSVLAAEDLEKIRELHQVANRWDATAAAVPAIVERLKDLRALHEEAANFAATLTHMRATQDQVKEQLSTQDVTLKTLEQSLEKNAQTIETNFSSLQQRVEALMKKM